MQEEMSLFIEDNAIHFEYAHSIPHSQKCSVVHGHSARIFIEVFGCPDKRDMIIEFSIVKNILKKIAAYFDAKYIIAKEYVSFVQERCIISFSGPNGLIELSLPRSQTVILTGDPTIENIASAISDMLLSELPENIAGFKITVFEGIGKGAIITQKK